MTAVNHALTGTAIGLIVGQPWLAVPLAVASHYVCDVLPHYGRDMPRNKLLKSLWFRNYLLMEALACFLIVVALAVIRPQHWVLAAVCAFAAAAPDLLSARRYFTIKSGRLWKAGVYSRFATGIQWFERPIGAAVEASWFIAIVIILLPFLH